MHIIELTPLEVGVYNDHKADNITAPPEGWAMIPDDMVLPSTFPRLGSLKAEPITYTYDVEVEKEVTKCRGTEEVDLDGNVVMVYDELDTYTEKEMVTEQRERVIMTVTEMTEGTLPEPVEPEPTEAEQMRADIEYLAIMTGVEL